MKEMGFNLNKMELRDAIKLRYDCLIDDIPCTCVCGEAFSVDHAMICKRGGFVIQLHNGLHDIEAELLSLVCNDVQTEPVLQDITDEQLSRGTNKVLEARLDTHARGFWGRQRSTFFDVRVCYPNVDLYQGLDLQQICKLHKNEKKCLYEDRVIEVECDTFTPLVFTTTGGLGKECNRHHSRLADLISTKKGGSYAKTISCIRAKTFFSSIRCALLCLRGSRTIKRVSCDIKNIDIQTTESAMSIEF